MNIDVTIQVFGWKIYAAWETYVVSGRVSAGEMVVLHPDGTRRGAWNGAVLGKRRTWLVCVDPHTSDLREFKTRLLVAALWWAWRNRRAS